MYASVNTIAHKLNIYPVLNNSLYFINKSFIKTRKYPIISIILFIIVIVLNSIQYHNNDKDYLQKKIKLSDITYDKSKNVRHDDSVHTSNTLLYIYDLIGINGFINNTPAHIFFYILTYLCLSLIEMNIGYLALLFLLFIDLMFMTFWDQYQDAICRNEILSSDGVSHSAYCCGSFILFMALGFVLYIIQNNVNNIYLRSLVILIIIFTFFMCSLYEKNITFEKMQESSQKTCKIYTWHAANFMFGIACAAALSK